MKKWLKRAGYALAAVVLVASGLVVLMSYNKARAMVAPFRGPTYVVPSDYGLECETVTLTCEDGLKIATWYIPSRNRAVVILESGIYGTRTHMLDRAAMLARHGYGLMLVDARTRGMSEGNKFTVGKHEVRDIDAACRYLVGRPDVDARRIGALGDSMGGVVMLLHAARNPGIMAVVADSPFASLQDEVETGVTKFTGLPPLPFAPFIQWFSERENGVRASEVAPIDVIHSISPRSVFLMQGGKDTVIPTNSGQRLYDASGEPRQLWFEPDLEHIELWWARPWEYEKRVVAFFDQYLLAS
jgi:dienelactone hydrolase